MARRESKHDEKMPSDDPFIPIPQYRKVLIQFQKRPARAAKESVDEESVVARHRPFELTEKRERKREEELIKYNEYIKKLKRQYPELFR